MRIRDFDPKFPVMAQAIYPEKTISEDIRNIPAMRRFIERHEAQGAHWAVFTWQELAQNEDSWEITLEKRLSIGFTQNMQEEA